MNGRKEKLSREIEFISKSQRKRDAQLVKSLASELISLNSSQLAEVPLEASVREAVQEARQIRSHVAGKRQLQFIAKQLRRIDATPIRESIDSFQNKARQLRVRRHRVETGVISCWNRVTQHWENYCSNGAKQMVRPFAN